MKEPFCLHIGFLLAAALLLACDSTDIGPDELLYDASACFDVSRHGADDSFSNRVSALVPEGTSLAEAKMRFGEIGFTCHEYEETATRLRHYCERIVPKALTHLRWVVSIDTDERGDVQALRSGCSETGL